MSGVCEELNFPGAAHWFRVQSEEERGHALRLFDFIHARNHGVSLRKIQNETARVQTPARGVPRLAGAGGTGQPAD